MSYIMTIVGMIIDIASLVFTIMGAVDSRRK